MHVVQSALYRAENMAGLGVTGSRGAAGDAFSKIFGSTLDGLMRKGGIGEALNQLRERFPGIKIQEGESGTGVDEAKKTEAGETADSDEATVSSSVLAGMFDNSDVAKMVEDAISGLLERASDSNLMNFNGAFVQRSVTVTFTQVRYTEYHRNGETGDLMAAADLKTNFHEQLNDLIRKFFGGSDKATNESDDSDSEKTDAASGTGKTGSAGASAAISMWSLEIYYSASYMTSAFDASGSNANADGQNSWQAAWQQTSFSASLRGSLSGVIPSAIQNSGGGSTIGNSQIWKSLETTLASYGLAIGGLRQTQDGFMAKLREGRNLLAELMEMYGGRINGAPANAVEEETIGETSPVEVEPEEAMEAVTAV